MIIFGDIKYTCEMQTYDQKYIAVCMMLDKYS